MKLKIRNVNKKGLERRIKKCIQLLDDEHKNIDFTINFYSNPKILKRELETNPVVNQNHIEQILSGETVTAGYILPEQNEIKIFLFHFRNLKRNNNEIINLVGNIYHEIRHAWQYSNNLYLDERKVETIDGNEEDYLRQPSEKDAFKFQDQMMKKYAPKILEIFDISPPADYKYSMQDWIKEIVYS